jgi:hypothetical protein
LVLASSDLAVRRASSDLCSLALGDHSSFLALNMNKARVRG